MPRNALKCASIKQAQESLALTVADRRGQKQALSQRINQLEAEVEGLAMRGAILSPQWVQALAELTALTRLLADIDVALHHLLLQIEAQHTSAVDLGCEPRAYDPSLDEALAKNFAAAAEAQSHLVQTITDSFR